MRLFARILGIEDKSTPPQPQPQRKLPPGFHQLLKNYGEYLVGDRKFDQRITQENSYRTYAREDPDGFVNEVSAGVPAAEGEMALGACEVIYNIVRLRPNGDAWHHLMGQAVLYLKYREVSWSNLKDYQREFLRSEGVEQADW